MIRGLSTSETKDKLQAHGYNELPSSRPKNVWRIAVEVIREPMFLLLISCGVLYVLLGDYKEGIVLLSTIFIIIGITFYQYRKTERALDALKKLSSPNALVMRDGMETLIPAREIVPGDLLILNEGDRISADGIVTDSVYLTVDESVLTGESMAVQKATETETHAEKNTSLVFNGTLVVRGKGMATVTETGIQTRLGKIGTSLGQITEEETRLQKEMKILIRNLSIAGIFLCIAVVVLFYVTRGNFIQSLLNGLSSAMAVLPEEFPVVLTVFLALGAWRLSTKNVLTRKPSAIETLGSATVLCSDKTGTITQNKMEVMALYDGNDIFYIDFFHQNDDRFFDLTQTAFRASRDNPKDPMEKAIIKIHEDLFTPNKKVYELIKEYSLSEDLMAMTRVLNESIDNELSVSAKGAPEAIFRLCRMKEDEIKKHLSAVHTMAENGLRVIAVSNAEHKKEILPENQSDFDFQFLGLIGLKDPIRTEVPMAIRECKEAGVKVILITGDFPATAKNVALQIGLSNVEKIITGDELKKMTKDELKEKIRSTFIFARVIPEQKLLIVEALKANGEIVAMTGDGVNDAPALKAAHIGIAMGQKGTDVAREASSLVLLDDHFASIVSAIRLGRRIFDNLQKVMSYILAIHIPIIGLTLLPAFIPSFPILLMPLHIVFMELIIDPVCSVAFESEAEEKNIMKRPPRKKEELFFGKRKILFSLFQGSLLLVMVLSVLFISVHEGHTDAEVRAVVFSSLIIGN
ncbi:MAG: cation-translocating P-type ATPase, partial [Bacteroidia bacterium]